MTKFHLIYRPATKEYVQFCDIESCFGPHVVWTRDQSYAYQFESRRKAAQVAETITQADKIRMQIITFKEEGRNTIECA
ncbi:hypothetical protein [Lihuaxuella thermophila]|uniref:Uncharacterized protein n=1 Tax=Lihuaxuella thermophila TaxID=1173111 RepID=A0A1H8JBE1_9BACL|nr:hypothetical protein [Lihuaxuella thermophila]SEN53493.1 hypothetical protein SAMN05444955_113129 [Lihuaxuella thermophila]SEN78100.1 hypothetical protein SAMN05444955_12330 [Lihuaxuella thermophila]SEN80488.1 hypothetical protein SAMN05444955_12612 [Lihuaxuella thermophila]